MFMGNILFVGKLHSCRIAGMCILLLISDGKSIKLIKKLLYTETKSITLKHFQNKWFDWRGTYQTRNKLKYYNLLELLFNIKLPFLCISLFCFIDILASTQQNLSSGFQAKRNSDQSPHLQRLARKLNVYS